MARRRSSTPAQATHISVAVRVRPPLAADDAPAAVAVAADEVTLTTESMCHAFRVDHAWMDSSQEHVYESLRPAVQHALDGFNSAILAYGQTGSGKTYTMFGGRDTHTEGVIPRAVRDICAATGGSECSLSVSFLQIYNELISDLLAPEHGHNLLIREERQRGIYVEGLSEIAVGSAEDVAAVLRQGHAARATAATAANEVSSRSHAVFTLTVHRRLAVAKLVLVDLAGSESARGGASGQRLQECRKINQSLSALGNVIHALSRAPSAIDARGGLHLRGTPVSPGSPLGGGPHRGAGSGFAQAEKHVPYRDSKLTRLLQVPPSPAARPPARPLPTRHTGSSPRRKLTARPRAPGGNAARRTAWAAIACPRWWHASRRRRPQLRRASRPSSLPRAPAACATTRASTTGRLPSLTLPRSSDGTKRS